MNGFEYMPFLVSMRLAFVTTIILFIAGMGLSVFIVYSTFRWKVIVEIIVSLPMVLPPTVLGFYMLVIFSPENGPGKLIFNYIGTNLLFSFAGIVTASCVHSLPYMVQPLKSGLSSVNNSLIESAYTLGKGKVSVFMNVILPNIKVPVFTAVIMTFLHVMGEFGVVLMIGGSVPGETRVAAIALYEKVEMMEYGKANIYALVLVLISLVLISIVYYIQNYGGGENDNI